MRILPINSVKTTNNTFKSKLMPTPELKAYKSNLSEEGLKHFETAYDKFLNDGKNNIYKFVHETFQEFDKDLNRFIHCLYAIIEDESGFGVASKLMSASLREDELEPDFNDEKELFEEFLGVEHEESIFDSPVFDFCRRAKRIVHPYKAGELSQKEYFMPDL